jgi:O-antigen/teichoic acid export membrane protein
MRFFETIVVVLLAIIAVTLLFGKNAALQLLVVSAALLLSLAIILGVFGRITEFLREPQSDCWRDIKELFHNAFPFLLAFGLFGLLAALAKWLYGRFAA